MRGEDRRAISISNALYIRTQILVSNHRNFGLKGVSVRGSIEFKPLEILSLGVLAQYLRQNPSLYRISICSHFFYELQRNHNERPCQKKYVVDLLKKVNMADAKGIKTPMIHGQLLSKVRDDSFSDPSLYRSIVGALQFQYATVTRPDIAFSAAPIQRFTRGPPVRWLLHPQLPVYDVMARALLRDEICEFRVGFQDLGHALFDGRESDGSDKARGKKGSDSEDLMAHDEAT
ncbi:Retrovirus-related Pol polyprotein from transposon TNT 1-94 [Senna tora]|uniref:Retrovirus-related Pol polyprotein from transposon TNT 1-94 n=1 Tax=Senna tora TaxID=362788 RepID=A0A834WAE8_9FABA|nr:Retrovirus-related Pol polyprotein from transposon TNT 1-94 [Senna tora]